MPVVAPPGDNPTPPPKPPPKPPTKPPLANAPSWYSASVFGNTPYAWEDTLLNQMYNQGQLSGVPPEILAAMSMAESSGQGGAINSAGYGGFFGTAPNRSYQGNVVTRAQELGTDPASFEAQAKAAASDYASMFDIQSKSQYNPYYAEAMYQAGPNQTPAAIAAEARNSEGANVFRSFNIPFAALSPTGIAPNAGLTGGPVSGPGNSPTSGQQANSVNATLQDQFSQYFKENKTVSDALLQQLSLTGPELAQQQRILQENYQFSQEQQRIQEQQLGLNMTEAQQQAAQTAAQRGFQQQQDILSGQTIQQNIANIIQNYQLQQQGLAMQGTQGRSSLAGAGVYNTGAHGMFEQQQHLATTQAAVAEQQAIKSQQEQLQGLGITEQAQASQYGYTQQQIQNGMKNIRLQQQSLGISEQQAHEQYQNALMQLNMQNIMGVNELTQQIAALAGGGYSPIASAINQFQQFLPGVAGLLGGGSQLSGALGLGQGG